MGAAHTAATTPRQPMAALARGLGAACRISVARLRPAESDVRGMSSTRSKTVGAVRQVRGGAEAGFWVVCWVARGSARQLIATLLSVFGVCRDRIEAFGGFRVTDWAAASG